MAPRPDARVLLAFSVIVLLLGANFVAVRFSNRELDPFYGAGLRFVVATLLLAGAMAALRIPVPRGRALLGASLYGALAFGVNFGLTYWGMLHVSAGLAAVVFATIPLTTLLLATAIGQERMRGRALVGALVAVAGIAAIFREQITASVPVASLLAVTVAAVAGASSGIVVKAFPRSHPLATNAVGMAVGAAMLVAASEIASEWPRVPTRPETWAALGWLVASSVTAFSLMVWVLARWTASATSYISVLVPLVTVSLAAALAGETVTPTFVAGALVVLLAVWIGVLWRAEPAAPVGPPRPVPAPPPKVRP